MINLSKLKDLFVVQGDKVFVRCDRCGIGSLVVAIDAIPVSTWADCRYKYYDIDDLIRIKENSIKLSKDPDEIKKYEKNIGEYVMMKANMMKMKRERHGDRPEAVAFTPNN